MRRVWLFDNILCCKDFSLIPFSSQLTFQWVVHVIDGMDYRGQTREELSWTRVSDKKFAGSSF